MREYFSVNLKSRIALERQRYDLLLPKVFLRNSGTRVLVVADIVHTEDIDEGKWYSSIAARAVHNAMLYADEKSGGKLGEYSVINFEEFSVVGMDEALRKACHADFAYRVEKYIKKYKPHTVVLMGADVIQAVTGLDDISSYFGRLKQYKNINIVYTLGLRDFCPDQPYQYNADLAKKLQKNSSLIGFVWRHMETAIRRKNLFSIPQTDFKIRMVDTLPKFKKLMKLIRQSKVVAFDTETESLSRVTNKLLTIQIAVDDDAAYILPFYHPGAKWSREELEYVKRDLKKYFESEYEKTDFHLYQNPKFDLVQLRHALNLRFYGHEVYDTQAGEYALDENLKFLSDRALKHLQMRGYQLDYICKRYGWDAYKNAGVDKNSRSGFREMSLDKFARYAALDVIVLFRIAREQIKVAKHEGWEVSKYIKFITDILGSMSHVFAAMEYNGHKVDTEYLTNILRVNGKVDTTLREIDEKFKKSKAAQRVNKRMLAQQGAPKRTLFGGAPWEFKINKPAHQQELFIQELGIEPLSYGKTGAASIGKAFLKKYGEPDSPDYVKEVGLYAERKKLITIKNNFLSPFFQRMVEEPDMISDQRLRASYSFLQILTGRSGSFNPNFQNIPSHGDLAKLVKRNFIPALGNIYFKVDFGAHEVGNWANVSGDNVLGDRFVEATRLKRRFFLTSKESEKFDFIVNELKTKGDIHIQNVKFFFGKWVDKKHPLRQQIKAVVFGVIYGKQSYSLSLDLGISEEDAQALIEKLFATFPIGGKWLIDTQKNAQKDYLIETPFFMQRHLWGYMIPERRVWAALDRRGPNSVIQGASSQQGYLSGRIYQQMKWDYFYSKDLPLGSTQNNGVHDSMENESRIAHLPINLYLVEHAMTTQLSKYIQNNFGWELKRDFDIEFEIGGSLSALETWNGRYDDLEALVDGAVKFMHDELGRKTPELEMRKLRHNIDVVFELRKKEVKNAMKSNTVPCTEMLLDHETVKELKL